MTHLQPQPDPEREAAERELHRMQAANVASIQALAANGVNPSNVTPVLTAVRLEALLEAILSPEDRLTYETIAETRMAAALEQLKNQVARARLTQGIMPVKANGNGKRT